MKIHFIAIVALFQLVLIFLSFIVYKVFIISFGFQSSVILALLVGLSFVFIIAPILAMRYESRIVRWFHFFSMYWIVLVVILFAGSFVFILLHDIATAFKFEFLLTNAVWLSFWGSIFIYFYGISNARTLRVKKIDIEMKNIPEWWRGKKIVFLSDTHLGNEYRSGFSKKIVKKIRFIAPEAVFIGGDFFDGVKCDAEKLIHPFKNLKIPHGIYFISGNHDYSRYSELFFKAIRNSGITILKNKVEKIEGINFYGVDYEDTKKKETFKKVLSDFKINRDEINVLIKHVPDNVNISEEAGIKLQLSGHTHHGQVFPLLYLTRFLFDGYDYGLKKYKNMKIYISSGAGAASAPFRFGTNSEIVVIKFV
jgi:hypothetical protein